MILADERLFCASSVSAHYFVEFSLKSDEVKSRKTFYFGYCFFLFLIRLNNHLKRDQNPQKGGSFSSQRRKTFSFGDLPNVGLFSTLNSDATQETLDKDHNAFMQRMKQRMQQRRAKMKNVCKQLGE